MRDLGELIAHWALSGLSDKLSSIDSASLLELRQVHAWYGKGHVLQGIDLRVGKGEIVSLLGRNGAGRSTVVKAVMGQVNASGSILFMGRELIGMQPCRIARMGVGLVPESRDIFPALTVEQNLLLGEKPGMASRWRIDDMYALFPALKARRTIQAGVLSGGEQQMLALGRTMMGDPQLVMIDEPTEGLAPKVVEQVGRFLHELKERGVSVLLIEQKLSITLEISQRVYVMGRGTIVFEGSPEALRRESAIRREWLQV